MTSAQILYSLSQIIDKLHNAMDEIEDVVDNDIPKVRAQNYLLQAEMQITDVIDEFEVMAIHDGSRSGAV